VLSRNFPSFVSSPVLTWRSGSEKRSISSKGYRDEIGSVFFRSQVVGLRGAGRGNGDGEGLLISGRQVVNTVPPETLRIGRSNLRGLLSSLCEMSSSKKSSYAATFRSLALCSNGSPRRCGGPPPLI